VSNLNDVETVETVEGAEATRMARRKGKLLTLDQHIGIRIPGGKQSFQLSAAKGSGPIHSGMPRSPRSSNGIIESKKSAEWWNMINDQNREWTESPKDQESQTQQDYDLVDITSMRNASFFFAKILPDLCNSKALCATSPGGGSRDLVAVRPVSPFRIEKRYPRRVGLSAMSRSNAETTTIQSCATKRTQWRYLLRMKPSGPLTQRKLRIANVAINRHGFITSSFRCWHNLRRCTQSDLMNSG